MDFWLVDRVFTGWWSNDWRIDWQIDWLNNWFIGLSVSWLVPWLIYWLIDWTFDCMINRSIDNTSCDQPIDWLIDRPAAVSMNWHFESLRGRFIPESTRYLLVRGQTDKVEALLRKIATVNGKEYPDESVEQPPPQRTGDFRDLFRTRAMLYQTLITWYMWWVACGQTVPHLFSFHELIW